MLKTAFNTMTRLHSRAATLKRLGSPDLYSPIRITPSNYFRYLEGPGHTVVRGREFVIPKDTMLGTYQQLITFEDVPTAGKFTLTHDGNTTGEINFDDTASEIQTLLRALDDLSAVTVSGDFSDGFTVTFLGVQTPLLMTATKVVSEELDEDITVAWTTGLEWTTPIKRGDKILDATYGSMAIDEIIEMVDVGGEIMGYRCRCE